MHEYDLENNMQLEGVLLLRFSGEGSWPLSLISNTSK